MLSIKGILHEIMVAESIENKKHPEKPPWVFRKFVVELEKVNEYPQFRIMQGVGEVVDQLDWLKVGQFIECQFIPKGRKYIDTKDGKQKFYNLDETVSIRLLS